MKIASMALIGLLASGLAHAHGDEKHSGKQHEEKAPHAAALGKPADLAAATRTVEVRMSDAMRFSPANIRVKRGETIRFVVKNDGKLKHELVLGTMAELKEHAEMMRKFPEMEHEDPNSVSVEPGKTGEFAWRFTKDGKFDFACLIPGHFEAGMRGKLMVNR